MRYTVDLEKKEVVIYTYDKKWKKYREALEKVYVKKGYVFKDEVLDYNSAMIGRFQVSDEMTWTTTATPVTGSAITNPEV